MPLPSRPLPQLELLHAHFSYDPATGELRWRDTRKNKRNRETRGGRLAGTIFGTYRTVGIDGEVWLAHRLIWKMMTGEDPPHEVDHVDRNRRNNRWTNLRSATRSQNCGNTTVLSRNKTGLKGVYPVKGKALFRARIMVQGRHICLGFFKSPEDAHAAYLKAAQEHFGEYHRGQ